MKTNKRQAVLCLWCAAVLATLTACGGGDSGPATPPPAVSYTVGGTVTGLAGTGLTLQNNGGDDLAISASGAFAFRTGLATDAKYAITVKTQPSSPAQSCLVSNGAGTVGTANITGVTVACTTLATVTVGGTVTGLTGSGLVLEYNDTVNPPVQLAVPANGIFTFPSGVPQGSAYQVRVATEPGSPTQNCVVTSGSGVVGSQNISNISVACAGVGRFAYVSNAGDSSISVYAIDPTTGALTTVGTPVPTGTSPYGLVGSPDGLHVYVVNETSNSISAYAVDSASGTLTQVPGSPFAAGTDPQALAFDPTGTHLYVVNSGADNLSAYAVDALTGALTPLPTAIYATGTGPTAVSVDRAGKFVMVANSGSNDISVFAIAAGTGALTPVSGSPFAAGPPGFPGVSPLSLAFVESPVFYGLYVSAFDPANGLVVTTFAVDNGSGVLTFASGWLVQVENYIATDRNGEFLYGATRGGVVGYGITDASGDLSTVAGYPYAAGRNAYSVTVDPSNQFLYVANEGAGTVSGFKRNPDGSLIAITGAPFIAGHNPVFIAIL